MVDGGELAALVQAFGLRSGVSAGVGYMAGAVAHYSLSRRFVFSAGWLAGNRWTECAAFIGVGLCGLVATVGVVHLLSERIGMPVALAKVVAVLISFALVYLLRARLVFRRSGSSGAALGK